MSPPAYFTRARLRDDASTRVLVGLMAGEEGNRVWASHRLIWSLFADSGKKRPFLYREEPGRLFYILSDRPPRDEHNLFEMETKPFEPVLNPGERLSFTLRANPTVDRRGGGTARSHRADVVMDAKRRLREAGDDVDLGAVIRQAGLDWFAARAEKAGFSFDDEEIGVDGYRQVRLPRRDGNGAAAPIRFSMLDLAGKLTLKEPHDFLPSVLAGFGRARAFGCGLMLVRRAGAA